MNVKIKKVHPDAIIPVYATKGSAGFDLSAIEGGIVSPGERKLVKTGLAFEIPEGYVLQVDPRSGLANKFGITVLNSPGNVDSDYRGEVGVILINHGNVPYAFAWGKGDKIAQGVIVPIKQATFTVVDALTDTDRGSGGFGSTDKPKGDKLVINYEQY